MADQVAIEQLHGLGLASVLARKAVEHGAVARALGLDPAVGPRCSHKDRDTLIGVGPASWLLVQENRTAKFIPALRHALGETAWVADQSGAYGVFRIAGAGARTLLQRGVAVDLHPDAFVPGDAASTSIAHINVLLWRLDDAPCAFAVAVSRSYEVSFRHWLDLTLAALSGGKTIVFRD